jgi:predicted metal-dependent hydrolase
MLVIRFFGGWVMSDNIDYVVVRTDRRTICIRILPDLSVQVRAPLSSPDVDIVSFVASHQEWIKRSRLKVTERAASRREMRFRSGETLPFLGSPYRLDVRLALSRQRVQIRGDAIVAEASNPEDEAAVRALLERWYVARARERFPSIIDGCLVIAARYGITRPEIRIRTMRSRWGTCNPRKRSVTLNAELVKYPKEAIELVIMHELSHFQHRGHDKDFYEFLEILLPDWKARKTYLKHD